MSASGSLAGQGVGHEDKHHAGDQLEGRVGKNHRHDQPCQLLCRQEHPDHHHGLRPAGVLPELAAAAPDARNADSRRQCRAPEGRTATQRGDACPRGDPAADHRRAGRRVGSAVAGDAGQGALHPHPGGAVGDRHPRHGELHPRPAPRGQDPGARCPAGGARQPGPQLDAGVSAARAVSQLAQPGVPHAPRRFGRLRQSRRDRGGDLRAGRLVSAAERQAFMPIVEWVDGEQKPRADAKVIELAAPAGPKAAAAAAGSKGTAAPVHGSPRPAFSWIHSWARPGR